MPGERYGVWVAYHYDWSGFAIFDQEIEALRHAVQHSMQVKFVGYGKDVREEAARG